MKAKRYICMVLLLMLLIVNLYILFQRNNGYKYYPFKSYTQVYVTDSTFYLADLQFFDDSLRLMFSLPPSSKGYRLHGMPSVLLPEAGNCITMPIKDGIREYILVPVDSTAAPITIKADHSPVANSLPREYVNEFIYSSLPGPRIKVSPFSTWTKCFEAFSQAELDSGNKLLKTKTRAFSVATDSARVMEVAKFAASLPRNAAGMVAGPTGLKPPYEQIQLALANKTDLICGNYAAIIYYLCSVLRMPNRMVTYQGPAGNWRYGVHYLNEIYLRDKQQWVLADGMSNIYLPHDSIRYYNVADIKKMTATNGFNNKYAYRFIKGGMYLLPYDSINQLHEYYNASNANICYIHPESDLSGSTWKYLKAFYSFSTVGDFYSDVNTNNWVKIFVKMAAFALLILAFIAYIVWELGQLFK